MPTTCWHINPNATDRSTANRVPKLSWNALLVYLLLVVRIRGFVFLPKTLFLAPSPPCMESVLDANLGVGAVVFPKDFGLLNRIFIHTQLYVVHTYSAVMCVLFFSVHSTFYNIWKLRGYHPKRVNTATNKWAQLMYVILVHNIHWLSDQIRLFKVYFVIRSTLYIMSAISPPYLWASYICFKYFIDNIYETKLRQIFVFSLCDKLFSKIIRQIPCKVINY